MRPLEKEESKSNRIKNFSGKGKTVLFEKESTKRNLPQVQAYINMWMVKKPSEYPTQTFTVKLVSISNPTNFFTRVYK